MQLDDYVELVRNSDKLPPVDIRPALLGLFGEVGGILTTAKKLAREKTAYLAFEDDAIEELGDTLWYMAALSRRIGVPLQDLLQLADDRAAIERSSQDEVYNKLLELVRSSSALADLYEPRQLATHLRVFAHQYQSTLRDLGISFSEVVRRNSVKVSGRFLPPDFSRLPTFDSAFDPDEQLPPTFEFCIRERKCGQTYMSLNGVFVGDSLADNIGESDGYRFHDVFHMANAAVLHWSPVLRALLKRKRKSDTEIDRSEDSGRAIVVEEGLSAWLFSRAKQHKMFEGYDSISFDILKRISEFVDGYEVSQCPQSLWERAILQGFDAFRRLRAQGSGVIIGDRGTRTISFRSLP